MSKSTTILGIRVPYRTVTINVNIVLKINTLKINTENRVLNDLEIFLLEFDANATERREGIPDAEIAEIVEIVAMTN